LKSYGHGLIVLIYKLLLLRTVEVPEQNQATMSSGCYILFSGHRLVTTTFL